MLEKHYMQSSLYTLTILKPRFSFNVNKYVDVD